MRENPRRGINLEFIFIAIGLFLIWRFFIFIDAVINTTEEEKREYYEKNKHRKRKDGVKQFVEDRENFESDMRWPHDKY